MKLTNGQTVEYKAKYTGYPRNPWSPTVFKKATFVGLWSIDEVVVKDGNCPVIVCMRDVVPLVEWSQDEEQEVQE